MKSTRYFQKINAHLNAAKAYSNLSYSRRLKVGAVIVKDDRIVSIGYNGTVSGKDNSCEWIFWPNTGVKNSLKKYSDDEIEGFLSQGAELITKDEVVHSEANAILFAAKNGIKIDGCAMIITHSPCFGCAKMIAQSGIKEVYYEEKYRNGSPIPFLEQCGVYVRNIGGNNG